MFCLDSKGQYIFVHLAVYEALSCGNTEIEAHKLNTALKNLSTVDKHKNKTGFVMEFQVTKTVVSKEIDLIRQNIHITITIFSV